MVEDHPRDFLAGVDRAPRNRLQALGSLGLLGIARAVFPVPAVAWPAWLCNATQPFQSCAMAFDKRREKPKPRGRRHQRDARGRRQCGTTVSQHPCCASPYSLLFCCQSPVLRGDLPGVLPDDRLALLQVGPLCSGSDETCPVGSL